MPIENLPNDVSQADVSRMAGALQRFEREEIQGFPPEAPAAKAPKAKVVMDLPAAVEVQEPVQADAQPSTDELPVSDLPEVEIEQTQSGDLGLDIVHDGQERHLSRAEAIELAQKGFDYDVKTRSVAQKDRAISEALQRATEVEQLMSAAAPDMAEVKALERQLLAYQNFDWVRFAGEQPQQYPVARAQFDQLAQAYNGASNRLQQKLGTAKHQLDTLKAQQLQSEWGRLPEMIPEWRDPQRLEKERGELKVYLSGQGMPDDAFGRYLDNALAVSIARKAMLYDRAVANTKAKSKQLREAPPVSKPGSTEPGQARTDRYADAMKRLNKSGRPEDAVAALMARNR